jgi:iron complex outermembrane receptor protein
MRSWISIVSLTVLAGSMPGPASGQSEGRGRDLARLSIEELLNVEVTSVSRKEERAAGAAAAVYVITQDDIRRSGIRTLPELFRLAPGVQVAQVNASNWAVSIRGFNDVYANKLLVLIDGRSIYNRTFSGVLWSMVDVAIDDIERIEVVRGPGGAIWGANAVNGVINIVTKPAADTQGALVRLGRGSFDGTEATLRYGGTIGNAAWRIYTQWTDREASRLGRSTPAGDQWDRLGGGFRVDGQLGATSFMVAASGSDLDADPLWEVLAGPPPDAKTITGIASHRHAADVIGRATRSLPRGASLQFQSFFSYRVMHDVNVVDIEKIADVDVEYRVKHGRRHDFIAGGGYRDADDRNDGSFAVTIVPRRSDSRVFNIFAQDEILLHERVRLTLGSKFEHDNVAGPGLLPTARLAWNVVPGRHHAWTAISKARRTPSWIDLGLRAHHATFTAADGTPVLLRQFGDPAYRTEELVSAEAGYRFSMGSAFSVDATVFRGDYDRLKTNEPLEPHVESAPAPHLVVPARFANLLDVDTAGVELAVQWTPLRGWRLDGSYSGFRMTPRVDPASRDVSAALFDGNAPAHQYQVRSTVWVGRRAELQAALYHAGRLKTLAVPAYTRIDVTAEIALREGWSLAVAGRNLAEPTHVEYSGLGAGMTATAIPRNGSAHLIWRF